MSYHPFIIGATPPVCRNNEHEITLLPHAVLDTCAFARYSRALSMPKFSNPWPSFAPPKWFTILSSISLSKAQHGNHGTGPLVQIPHFSSYTNNVRCMWLGHASVYLQLPTDDGVIGVIFDPVFSDRSVTSRAFSRLTDRYRCSPISFLGPKRRIPPPCSVKDLPRVDLVIISHDHCMFGH